MATAYGFEHTLESVTFDEARDRVTKALAEEGFGVLTEIDVPATLKKKLGVDFRRYSILGACNPPLAHRALLADPQIGLLLPCNVVIQESPKGILVSIASPRAMFSIVDRPDMKALADEVEERVQRVMGALRQSAVRTGAHA